LSALSSPATCGDARVRRGSERRFRSQECVRSRGGSCVLRDFRCPREEWSPCARISVLRW
jgi:hypothetical protein